MIKLTRLLNEISSDIDVSDYKDSNFIDGKTFSITGGQLTIAQYNRNRPYGIVELFVSDSHRRKGIATELLKYAMNYFNDGFLAQVSNEGSLLLHYKLGFRSFDNNLKEQSLEESRTRLRENSSVSMASPKLLKNLTKYFK